MTDVTFITGSQSKADYLAKYLGFPVTHQKIELDEIQSMDLKEIVEHKVRQAYEKIGSPVLVEDVSLEFHALGNLPGPFIKFFVENMPFETICSLVDGKSRKATARCVFGYYDGIEVRFFEGKSEGEIAKTPGAPGGYGWDRLFIPEGYGVTRSEMPEADHRANYIQIKPFGAVKEFLAGLDK